MRYKALGLTLALSLLLAVPLQAMASPAEAINNFAFSASRVLGQNGGAYFFSPFSIISAFGMAYAGASGATASEIERALGVSWGLHGDLGEFVQGIEQGGQVTSANRVWLNKGLKLRRDYQNTLYLYYRSTAEALDIEGRPDESRKTINDWVSAKTNGKIRDLLQSLDPSVRMVITNAVYFNAQWLAPFSKRATGPEKFHDGETVSEVPMMKKLDKFSYGEFDGVKAVRIPYAGRRMSMLVLLPPEDNKKALDALDAGTLSLWGKSLRRREVDLWLPKFKTERRYELGDLFKALGVKLAFSDDADFSGITDDERLKIDAVIHQTFIDVDEEKTEAAAATAITMLKATAMPNPEPIAEFHADRPFTYFILDDETGTILFMGRQTF